MHLPKVIGSFLVRLLVLVSLAGAIGYLLLSPDQSQGDCRKELDDAQRRLELPPPAQAPLAGTPTDMQPATLTLSSAQDAEILFGRAVDLRTRKLLLNPSGAVGSTFEVRPQEFLRDDGTRLSARGVDGRAFTSGKTVTLVACSDRNKFGGDHPGTYVGSFTILDRSSPDRTELANVPLTIKFAHSDAAALAVIYFPLVIFAGTFYSWALKRSLTADVQVFSDKWLSDYLRWWRTLGGVLAIAFGTAAAAAVFNAQYLSSGTWGSSAFQFVSLLIAMLAGFVSAATIAHLPVSKGS